MKKFCIKGTAQACLNDRLANAGAKVHTDLRSMEAKIYRIADMSLDDFFYDKLDKSVLCDFERLVDDTGFVITPETSYMKAASIIKQYAEKYPGDENCIDLIAFFLHPLWRFSSLLFWEESQEGAEITNTMLNNAILRKSRERQMRNFYVCMDDYVSALECMFPEDAYKQCFESFEKQTSILLEFVFKIINDSDELERKWQMLLKFMIDPYAKLYREKQNLNNWE